MRYASDWKTLVTVQKPPRIVTIGNFDGVHLGHRTVLAEARQEADRLFAELAVLTFEPHPAELLKPEGPRLRLVEPSRKTELLAECGADFVLAQRFDQEFADLSAEAFARDILTTALAANVVIVGENFRFGKEREGDVAALRDFGQELGFTVKGHQLIRYCGDELSSSRIRKLLQQGEVARAGEMLGRDHEVPGTVIKGCGKGSGLGFPTLNLGDVKVLVPGPGIYAAYCDVAGARKDAAVYVGVRPTMGLGYSLEAHLLDVSENLYDQRVVLHFVEKVRDDRKFANEQELVAQMKIDIGKIQNRLKVRSG